MKLNRKIYTTELGGEKATLEISELASQANAAVIGKHGDTVVLATAVMSDTEKQTDFFPLTVDYEERFYAAGKIIGSRFVRREGRPSDEATLSARLIDRTIRPLFDHRLRREVQVVVTILAYDGEHDPDPIALLASSAALSISDIPWNGPVAGVKYVEKDAKGALISQSFFAGPADKINMIEFEGKETSEIKAIEFFRNAQKEIKRLVAFQNEIVNAIGKEKVKIMFPETRAEVRNTVRTFLEPKLARAMKEKQLPKLKTELVEYLGTQDTITPEEISKIDALFEETVDEFVHSQILERDERPDGRKLDEIRDLYAEVGLFKRTHGSGLFMRGDTQVLAVTTLASPAAEQLIETMEMSGKRRFMLHYNFPSFSTGEVGHSRSPGRREIGHGALAAKAFVHLIPPKEKFPYTIRVVAETLSSNGSSSMASICATSLSLMDAGVPMKQHVAGIAMGLMLGADGAFKVLTDIQGPEDHYGDMDLKVAGTKEGITAIQMDVKVEGITEAIFTKALEDGKKARLHILKLLAESLPAPRPNVSPYAPTIRVLMIPKEKIGLVIGPGGRTIQGMIAATGGNVAIDIEEDGSVFVSGLDLVLVERTVETVRQLVHEYVVGEIVEGPVVKILDFGAIVDLGGGRDGMIHVSELKEGFVKKVEDVVHLGDRVRAKVVRVEPEGRIALSLKGVSPLSTNKRS